MAELTALGFGRTMEHKLHTVGIHTAEELRAAVSEQAAARLKERYPGTCVTILYYLEAALQGVPIRELDGGRKAELRDYFKKLP